MKSLKPNLMITFLNYCSLGLIAQVYTLTVIVIIVIFNQAIIDIEKFQYRPSLPHTCTYIGISYIKQLW